MRLPSGVSPSTSSPATALAIAAASPPWAIASGRVGKVSRPQRVVGDDHHIAPDIADQLQQQRIEGAERVIGDDKTATTDWNALALDVVDPIAHVQTPQRHFDEFQSRQMRQRRNQLLRLVDARVTPKSAQQWPSPATGRSREPCGPTLNDAFLDALHGRAPGKVARTLQNSHNELMTLRLRPHVRRNDLFRDSRRLELIQGQQQGLVGELAQATQAGAQQLVLLARTPEREDAC